jgi:hypothetical protein
MTNEQLASVIAEALKPVFAEGRRALLREIEKVKAQPTGMDAPLTKRQLYQFLHNPSRAIRATENGYFY